MAPAPDPIRVSEGLRDLIMSGSAVAFVGAGFSRPAGMPNWEELLRALLNRSKRFQKNDQDIANCEQCINEGDFAIAASYLRRLLPQVEIDQVTHRLFGAARLDQLEEGTRARMIERMQNLVEAPWAGIVTTNYDTLIERGFELQEMRRAVIAHDHNTQLGTALYRSAEEDIFFVKIHGSLPHTRIVLSSEEYDQVYIASPKIHNFLYAVMLSYSLIFIGASIESEILAIRRRLCVDFAGNVPSAYALLPASTKNRRREAWLSDLARIDTIFYEDGDHGAVDNFLTQCALIGKTKRREQSQLPAQAAKIRRLAVERKLQEIGSVNQAIYVHLRERCGGALSKRQLMGLEDGPAWPKPLSRLSDNELYYRLLFLVSIGLVAEHGGNNETIFTALE